MLTVVAVVLGVPGPMQGIPRSEGGVHMHDLALNASRANRACRSSSLASRALAGLGVIAVLFVAGVAAAVVLEAVQTVRENALFQACFPHAQADRRTGGGPQ